MNKRQVRKLITIAEVPERRGSRATHAILVQRVNRERGRASDYEARNLQSQCRQFRPQTDHRAKLRLALLLPFPGVRFVTMSVVGVDPTGNQARSIRNATIESDRSLAG